MIDKLKKLLYHLYLSIVHNDPYSKAILRFLWNRGDDRDRILYPLRKESVVFDVGGYRGDFAQKIFTRYQSTIMIFEPVHDFYSIIQKRFQKEKDKIFAYNFGLSGQTKDETIVIDRDESSLYLLSEGKRQSIQIMDIVEFMETNRIDAVDLIKINIEGGEYPLLHRMIDGGIISRFKNIQIQFHQTYPGAIEERNKIQHKLCETHTQTYEYYFVWENWTLRTKTQ